MDPRQSDAIARLVRETLSTLMSLELQDRVMARALALAGYEHVPHDVSQAMEWVRGSLSTAITETVSREAAELVIEQLAPRTGAAKAREVPRASSGEGAREPQAPVRPWSEVKGRASLRTSASRDDKTVPPPRRPTDNALLSDLPSVLFATKALSEVETVAQVVRGQASVQHIASLAVLLESLADPGLSHPVLLIDGQRSPLSPEALFELGADLPQGTMVVLWGGAQETWRAFADGYVADVRVFRCSPEASARDLAAFCLMLLS